MASGLCPWLGVAVSGTIDPEMGTVDVLSRTLFGRTRGAVLAVLYGHVGDSFHLRQLSRLTSITLGGASANYASSSMPDWLRVRHWETMSSIAPMIEALSLQR
jgi:hypothetical protein